jgi:S1-C subfamily serine protease
MNNTRGDIMNFRKTFLLLIIVAFSAVIFADSEPYIGINMIEPSLKQLEDLNADTNYGIMLSGIVKSSPAAEAGLKKFDILTKFNGEKLYTINQLSRMIDLEKVGNKVKFEYIRDGKKHKTSIVLADREDFINAAYGVHLGVYTNELSDWSMKKYSLDKNYGVQIVGIVSDSPAEKGGIQQNDIILEMAGEKIYTGNQVTKMLKNYTKNDVIKVKVWRDEKEMSFDITLDYRKAKQDFFSFFDKPQNVYVYGLNNSDGKVIGLSVETISSKKMKDLKIKSGVLVDFVRDDYPAQKSGVKIGDIILRANRRDVDSADDLRAVVKDIEIGDEVTLLILRGKKEISLQVEVVENEDHFEINVNDENIKILINDREEVVRDIKEVIKEVREDMKDWKDNELPQIKQDLKDAFDDLHIEIDDEGNI